MTVSRPLHALLLRTGLLERGTGGRHLQLDVAGVELGQQSTPPHPLALRHGQLRELARELESEGHCIVGRGHPCEILTQKPGAGSLGDLDRTHGRGGNGRPTAAPGRNQQKKQNGENTHTKKADFPCGSQLSYHTHPAAPTDEYPDNSF